jgi:hypothetical protein
MEQVSFFALASVVLSAHPTTDPLTSEPRDEEKAEAANQVAEQNLRVLCGIVSAMGASWVADHAEGLAEHIEDVYDREGDTSVSLLMDFFEHNLSAIEATLAEWGLKAQVALRDTDDAIQEVRLRKAIVGYGCARYEILNLLGDVEAQIVLCRDLILWIAGVGDSQSAQRWSATLIHLLEQQGMGQETVRAMLNQGIELRHDRQYNEAVSIMRQALMLAEQLGDSKLARQCKTHIGAVELLTSRENAG